MPNINRNDLDALSLTNFPNNTSQQISPADLRNWLENGIDSFVTQKDSSRLENVIYENEGSDIAASATVNLANATGNYLHITGAFNGITSFGTIPAGGRFVLVFDGICTLTYNATSLILPGASNITTAAGDCAMLVSEGAGNWRMVGFFPISGGGGGGITALTGDVTASGTGSVTATIANGAVDIPMLSATGTPSGTTFLRGDNVWGTPSGTGTVTSSGSPVSGDLAKFTSATDITKAVSGTDYLAPPSGTAILKANSGGALANATAGTDYLAPPSGTAIQKANSGGALANATAGTDYVAPGSATGSGLTMASSRLLGRTTASPNPGAIEEITLTTTGTSGAATLSGGTLNIPQYSGGSGTVNSGTFNRLAYYSTNPTGTAVSELPTAGSAGQILQSNGIASAPSWTNAPAATLSIGSAITSSTLGSILFVGTSTPGVLAQSNANLFWDNGQSRLGVGTSLPGARLQLGAGTGAVPHLILTPTSAATITGTTNGSLWVDTANSNTSITMRKDSNYTKIVTIDRNPDLATSGSGIVQADANGTLSKGAELTALGIFAQTSTVTVANIATSQTLIGTVTGVTTLPANFFGVGKTIKVFVSGTYNQANGSQDCALKLTIGGVSVGTITFSHNGGLTTVYYDAEFTLTCRTTGASGTLQFMGIGRVNHTGSSLLNFFQVSSTSASINTTGTLAIDLQADWVTADPSNSITASILTATYLN